MIQQILTLQRVATSQNGTFGVLSRNEVPLCVTCEDPWADNAPRVSCIPEGIYPVLPHNGKEWKNVWRLDNVPRRSAILIHAGNTIADTVGCILVGRSFRSVISNRSATRETIITDSVITLELLRKILPDNFLLKVLNPKTRIGD